ncbi:unnamed protein product [Dibothriocephalus latus]|uniref:SH3 domain-containing protein n=1 Tax=Dibothriocephalus latus TaxID=60516 RepID=A0A3P7M099_DIBLA|nr:unnamed protein product [Dibothriocephalus latus]
MTWLPVQEENKWRCVVSKYSDIYGKSLSLDLGDWVYVQLECDGITFLIFFSSGWYYGYKSAEQEVRGIFPKVCTRSPKDPQLCDVYAEILSLLPAVESAFILAGATTRADKFNIAIEFGRVPPNTTMYLASQRVSAMEVASGTQTNMMNGNTDPSIMGGTANPSSWIEACFKVYGDGSTSGGPSSKFVVDFHECERLSENVFFAEGRDSSKNTVVFSELKPFAPTEKRILLFIATSRVGAIQTKKNKTMSQGDNGIHADFTPVRRPLAAACVDITKDLIPILLPRKKQILSATARLANKRRKENNQSSRAVFLTSCNEEYQDECFLRLCKETPSSFVDFVNQSSTPAVQSDQTGNAALPPLANSALGAQSPNIVDPAVGESLEIEIKNIRPVDLQPYHVSDTPYPFSFNYIFLAVV